jgi:translation elongation factor EF-Tu-like GTPase
VADPTADDPLRFVVEHAFTITGRGTFVPGTIERGTVRRGAALRVEGTDLAFVVTAVEFLTYSSRSLVCLGAGDAITPDQVPPGAVLVPDVRPR